MKKLLTILLALSAMLAAAAANAPGAERHFTSTVAQAQPDEECAAAWKAAAATGSSTVKFIINIPDSNFGPSGFLIYNQNIRGSVYIDLDPNTFRPVPGAEVLVDLPNGTWDAMISYQTNNHEGACYIVAEQITVPGTTEVVFDSSTVTDCTTFHYALPGNVEFEFPYTVEDVWGETSEEFAGNLEYAWGGTSLICNAYGRCVSVAPTSLNGRTFDVNDENRHMPTWQDVSAAHHNPLSDRYSFGSAITIRSGKRLIGMSADGGDARNCVIDVDCSEQMFSRLSVPFMRTPANVNHENLVPNQQFLNIFQSDRKDGYGIYGLGIVDTNVETLLNLQSDWRNIYPSGWMPQGDDLSVKIDYGQWQQVEVFSIQSPPQNKLDGQWFTPSFTFPSASDLLTNSNFLQECRFNLDSPFGYYEREVGIMRGNSAPTAIQTTPCYEMDPGVPVPLFNVNYYGRLNEERSIDKIDLEYTVKYNGEVVCTEETDLRQFAFDFASEEHATGLYELEFVNNNVSVMFQPGYSKMWVKADWSTGDRSAPTITRLQFRAADGMMSDFLPTNDGVMMLAAGDYNYVYNNDLSAGYFQLDDIEVQAEYAPMGTGDWTELPIAEQLANTDHAEGFYYEAPMSGVDKPSESCYYDLRITLTDRAGNTQVQELSPAFFIQEVSSIGITPADNDAEAEAVYYNLQGIRIDRPTSGIYIVKRGSKTAKEMVR